MSDTYQKDTLEWRNVMDAALREEDSWLALAGLFWLEPGHNSFGTDASNDIVLPNASAPECIGHFELLDGTVKLTVNVDAEVKVDDEVIKEAVLQPDMSGSPNVVTIGHLTMVVVERGDMYGIRLWDNSRAERKTFEGRHWYPIQKEYRIEGKYHRYDSPEAFTIHTTIGNDVEQQALGYVSFALDGNECKLLAFESYNSRLSLFFKDLTSGKQTYPSGRFLVADQPEGDALVVDFNRAYSPPCAFTDYATCPLPPVQNHLKVSVEAGEIFDLHGH